MRRIIDKHQVETQWYTLVCQKLDTIKAEAHEFADDNMEAPTDELFVLIKGFLASCIETNITKLRAPSIWLTPDGGVGLTWKAKNSVLDVGFSLPGQIKAVITRDNHQQEQIEPGCLPEIFKNLAA